MSGRIAGWSLWRLGARAVTGLVAVELVAATLPVASRSTPSRSDYVFAASLVLMAVAYTWAALRWEDRRAINPDGRAFGITSNLFGIWCFAAIVLPLQLCAAVVVAIELAGVPARRAATGLIPHRMVYSLAVVVLDVCAATAVRNVPLPVGLTLPLAMLAYFGVNVAGYAFAIRITGGRGALGFLVRPLNLGIEFGCMAVGVAMLAAFQSGMGQFAWLSVPIALVAQRVLLRRELQGEPAPAEVVMVAEAWHLAARAVVRASSAAAVLRIDTSAPQAVAEVARVQAGCDAIGQNGPNGLAILLTDCPGPNADAIAARLRSAFLGNKIEAHVAVAAKPRDGQSLADLLAVSEAELIAMEAATRSARSLRPEA